MHQVKPPDAEIQILIRVQDCRGRLEMAADPRGRSLSGAALTAIARAGIS